MLGAIIGDVVGSRFEWFNCKSKDFNLFTRESCITDDSVTRAVAEAYYGIPDHLVDAILPHLDERILGVVRAFGGRTGLYRHIQ